MVGLLWMAPSVGRCLALGLPFWIASLVMIFYIFAVCGFMHLDGFYGLQRRHLVPAASGRAAAILKDSTVGAFAAVTLAFLLIAWFAAMSTAVFFSGLWRAAPDAGGEPAGPWRGLHVLTCAPIGHSQYAKDYEAPDRWKYRAAVAVQLVLWAVLAVLLSAAPEGL